MLECVFILVVFEGSRSSQGSRFFLFKEIEAHSQVGCAVQTVHLCKCVCFMSVTELIFRFLLFFLLLPDCISIKLNQFSILK